LHILEHAENDYVPLSQVFQLGGPLVEGAEEQHDNENDQGVGDSQPHIKAFLRVLEWRIADVEATLPSTVSGISSIMSSIVVIKNHLNLSKEAGAEMTGEVDSVRIKQAVVAAAGAW
jgi:hypothetical protein